MPNQPRPASSVERRHRPKTLTVFAAAFAAGVVLAYGVNRVVDVHVVQVEPQVESEPIFVALRSMPQGSPVTVWDVALKDWPKAMLPTTALKADASLEGMVLRHPIREGQPLLSVQLVRDGGALSGMAIAAVQAAAPASSGMPSGAGLPAPRPAVAALPGVSEQFVPATPAEPVATDPTDSGRPTVTAPISEPAPAVAAAAPVAEQAAATSAPMPRSTDVEETSPEPAAESPSIVAALPAPDVAPDSAPEPAPEPAPETVADSVSEVVRGTAPLESPAPTAGIPADAPLAAPVPALPPTDLGQSLTDVGRFRQSADARSESVLDRTTEAEPPTASGSAPKYHLVVPERIALAVDASFTEPQQPTETMRLPTADAPAREPQQQVGAHNRSSARRTPAANPSTIRKPATQQRPQPAARPQASPSPRGFNAWLPKFSSEGRQR